jgi:adenylate kinase
MIKQIDQRIFIVGPPGSHVRELALQFGLFLGITQCSSVGDLLSKEISKKTDIGKRIEGHLQNLKYVPDDIVIDLVKKQINTFEKEKKAFILEGFPKTRSQGLSLQKEGIIPDTFLLLDLPHDEIAQCVE